MWLTCPLVLCRLLFPPAAGSSTKKSRSQRTSQPTARLRSTRPEQTAFRYCQNARIEWLASVHARAHSHTRRRFNLSRNKFKSNVMRHLCSSEIAIHTFCSSAFFVHAFGSLFSCAALFSPFSLVLSGFVCVCVCGTTRWTLFSFRLCVFASSNKGSVELKIKMCRYVCVCACVCWFFLSFSTLSPVFLPRALYPQCLAACKSLERARQRVFVWFLPSLYYWHHPSNYNFLTAINQNDPITIDAICTMRGT